MTAIVLIIHSFSLILIAFAILAQSLVLVNLVRELSKKEDKKE